MKEIENLRKLFSDHEGVLTAKQLYENGINKYSVRQFLQKGYIEKFSRGVYTFSDSDEEEYSLIHQVIPHSIICLLSAAAIYNYTTHIPNEYSLAVKNKDKPTLPESPPIKIYYWKKSQYYLGIKSMLLNESYIMIYDKEKTVCDFVKFRNKLDKNVVKEVLKSYLSDKERNLQKLKEYSKLLKIETLLTDYVDKLI